VTVLADTSVFIVREHDRLPVVDVADDVAVSVVAVGELNFGVLAMRTCSHVTADRRHCAA